MFRNLLYLVVFSLGFAAVGWIGTSYASTNTLAFSVTLLIAAAYLVGAYELYHYRKATAKLEHAVADLSAPPAELGAWLNRLPSSLCNPVRLRIEGERVALPIPALTPYLVGLLVLLGMLGTLLGMMATLGGTGMALQSASDLQAIRASIAAPVQGLGFAFGTSIAGVSTSAMLGLLSALSRRERLLASQLLDTKIATNLRVYSQQHQREEMFKLLQQQTAVMPALVEQLQGMMQAIEQQSLVASERQLASQHTFHERSAAIYARLGDAMQQSLQQSISAGAEAASAALQPAIQNTLTALANETATLHATINSAVQQQLTHLDTGFASTTHNLNDSWKQALNSQQQCNQNLVSDLDRTLNRFSETFEKHSLNLLQNIAVRLDDSAETMAATCKVNLSQQHDIHQKLIADNQQALLATTATFEQSASALLLNVGQAHTQLQTLLANQDEQRLSQWCQALSSISSSLQQDLDRVGSLVSSQQQQSSALLTQTVRELSLQTQEHAQQTINEVSKLVQTASQAPQAAAEVIGELRQKLSESMARDSAVLEERKQLMSSLQTLLDSLGHTASEQRNAINAMVETSTELLERTGNRFSEQIQAEAGKLNTAISQITASSIEVSSLGEAFTAALQLFGKTNDKLATRLQRIEGALDKSLVRSDEQLAYYVAQAREIVDLSVLTQRQIIEELQQLALAPASSGAETA